MQLLQYQQLEHEHDINRLGSRLAFAYLLMHAAQVGPKRFPVDLFIQPNQRISHQGELGRAFRDVKNPGCVSSSALLIQCTLASNASSYLFVRVQW